eukprot:3022138-Alexandrium_andersonii.AAC.1
MRRRPSTRALPTLRPDSVQITPFVCPAWVSGRAAATRNTARADRGQNPDKFRTGPAQRRCENWRRPGV